MKAFLRTLVARLAAHFKRRRMEADMAEEMQEHIEVLTRANLAAGMSPQDARFAAQRRFGGADQVKEQCRDERGFVWLEQLVKDSRFAVRSLARSPGFTLTIVLTLAIGIGATAAIMNLARQILFPVLPFRDESRVVVVRDFNVRRNQPSVIWAPRYLAIREKATSFARLAALRFMQTNLVVDGQPAPVSAISVTRDFFDVLVTPALRGRTFAPEEYLLGAEDTVAVLSYDLWVRQFESDPNVVGRDIVVGDIRRRVVGIMPEAFHRPGGFPDWDVFLPMSQQTLMPAKRWPISLWLVGRLKPEVSLAQAQAEMATIKDEIRPKELLSEVAPQVMSIREAYHPRNAYVVWIFVGAMSFLYVIACTNALNLVLVRTVSRRGELGVRLALGSGRGRIVRLLFVENLCLTCVAGAAGALLANWGCVLFVRLIRGSWIAVGTVKSDGAATIVITLAITFLTSLVVSFLPAWLGGGIKLQDAIKVGGSVGGDSRRMQHLRSRLIITQTAMAVILLIGAGLMVRSFLRLRQTGVGFETTHRYAVTGRLPRDNAAMVVSAEDFAGIVQRVTDGFAHLPGVQGVAVADIIPMASGGISVYPIKVDGQPDAEAVECPIIPVSPGYFQALGQPLIAGHEFVGLKRGDPPVVVISESLARRLFSGVNPFGRRLDMGETALWRTVSKRDQTQRERWDIVGVVGDVRPNGPRSEPWPTCYIPFWQRMPFQTYQFSVLLQLAGKPDTSFRAEVLRATYRADPRLVVFDLSDLDDSVVQALSVERCSMIVLQIFSALALVLTATGLFAVMAYTVALRRQEFGVRVAMGATPKDLLGFVLWRGVRLAAAGVAVGLVSSWELTRLAQSALYGTSPHDPATYAIVAVMLLGVAIAACWVPARRAAQVDVARLLRAE